MTDDNWLAVLSRISPDQPLDLDRVIFEGADEKTPVTTRAAFLGSGPGSGRAGDPPSCLLWDRDASATSYLGVRVTSALPDCAYTALLLAAAALERQVIPIILTTLTNSGFERFGFRVERLPSGPADARDACEQELSRFWNMAIIIDAADVALIR